MIYLDNAATSFPKPQIVIKEVVKCIKKYGGNPGRSSHSLAISAASKIYETRETIAHFLSFEQSENIVFTPNATYALNLAIKGTVKGGCHCIVSDLEHNSVLRPLYKSIKKNGGSFSIYNTDIPPELSIPPLIRNDTQVIISTLASNVTGKEINLASLSSIASKYKLKLIIDASQIMGHKKIDLSNLNFSVICSAGHKALFGIQGSGFAVFGQNELLETLTEGGSGIDSFSDEMPMLLPERYEAGTLSTPGIASLSAGISYINKIGIQEIESHLTKLTSRIYDMLTAMPAVTLYGAENGIASFNITNIPSFYVSEELNKKGIATRSGFHCAPLIHKKMNTDKTGAVRVSLSYFNSLSDIETLYKVLKQIL